MLEVLDVITQNFITEKTKFQAFKYVPFPTAINTNLYPLQCPPNAHSFTIRPMARSAALMTH